jgi:hypothetical protein
MTAGDRETVDYVAICRLQSAYADVVNRRAWSEMADLFLPDAPVTVDTVTNPVVEFVGGNAVGEFIANAIERFEFFEFVILNTVVWLNVDDDTDRARARVFMCELRQERASGRFTRAFGVYHDDYRRTEGRWRFAARQYQSLARSGRGEVFSFPAVVGFA